MDIFYIITSDSYNFLKIKVIIARLNVDVHTLKKQNSSRKQKWNSNLEVHVLKL